MTMISPEIHSSLCRELNKMGGSGFQDLCRHLEEHSLEEFYPNQLIGVISEEEIEKNVYKYFPTYFASAFRKWNSEFLGDNEQHEENENTHYYLAVIRSLHQLLELRDLLMDFLPFLFMISLNRMTRTVIEKVARNQLIKSVNYYEKVYHHNSDEIDRGLQLRLQISLLELFRILGRDSALSGSFVLSPLFDEENSFSKLFPRSLDLCLTTFELIRVLNSTDSLKSLSIDKLLRIHLLCSSTFFEIISILTPIFKNFFLVYLERIDITRGIQYKGVGYAFSGINGPTLVEFFIEPGYRADTDKFESGNLYLINRTNQLQEDNKSGSRPLTPNDYLNLTPFILYTFSQIRTPIHQLGKNRNEDRDLFVFYSYEPEKILLRFLGMNERQIMGVRGVEQDEYWYLFEEYDIFLKHYKGLLADIERDVRKIRDAILPSEIDVSVETIHARTWELSIDHLSTVLRTELYDKNGNKTNELEIKAKDRFKFNESLYFPTDTEQILEKFYQSGKVGVIFIGKAGIGKTNLLCANYLRKRRENDLVLFLDARRFISSDIHEILSKSIAQRINENWNLGALNEYLGKKGKKLLIFIDAINEYSGPGGPIAFLQELINLISNSSICANLRIITSCRSETWFQYREALGINIPPLNTDKFFTNHNDAFVLEGFDSEESRKKVYKAYKDYYALTPETFDRLSPTVKELIKQPFIMRLVAETYSNWDENSQSLKNVKLKRVPKNLDYFRLFNLLTERKSEDAKRLLPIGDFHQEGIRKELPDCLFTFAKILLRNLGFSSEQTISPSGNDEESHSDAVPFDVLFKDNQFRRFVTPINPQSSITIFDMAIQVGLIEKIFITESDYWGNKREGRAYKFFHDQYSQYWISAVYSTELLGQISNSRLEVNQQYQDEIVEKVLDILQKSKQSPILAGAIDHWLYTNMCQNHNNIVDYLTIFLNRLAQHPSGFVRHYIGSFIYSLLEKNIIDSKTLFKQIVESKRKPLKKLIADHIIYVWQTLSPNDFRSLIEAFDDEEDDDVLREIGDIVADIYNTEPKKVCQLLDDALYGLENVNLKLITRGMLHRDNLAKHITLVVKFSMICILNNFSNKEKLDILREFLIKKYRCVVNAIMEEGSKSTSAKKLIKSIIYNKLEAVGINQWDQAIGPRDHNNKFFISHDGFVQRDALYDYRKYLIDYNNGDLSQWNLNEGTDFRNRTIEMIVYSRESIVGYIATLSLAIALSFQKEKIVEIVDELMQVPSEASTYFANILLSSLAFMKVESCQEILKIINDKVVPWTLSIGHYNTGLLAFASIVSINTRDLWRCGSAVLDTILNYIEATGDNTKVSAFSNYIVGVCFYSDVELGYETVVFMINRGFLSNPFWNKCLMSCLAALYIRNPKLVQDLLLKIDSPEGMEYEVKGYITQSMIEYRNRGVYQSSWNRFIVSGLTSYPKLRYHLIKDLFTGLIQSNSVPEFAKEFRRFVIETAREFLGNSDCKDYSFIDIEEALSQTESTRIVGRGEEWTNNGL